MRLSIHILTGVFLWGGIGLLLGQDIPMPSENSFREDVNVDDLGVVDDRFVELYFKALEYKSVDKPTRAIEVLEEALTIDSNQPYIYFEIGKNQAYKEHYDAAESNYKKSLELAPGRIEILENLYHLYFDKRAYAKALDIVNQMVKKDKKYLDNKANVLYKTGDYDGALELLDRLDDQMGKLPYRNGMRQQIYAASAKDVKKDWAKNFERLERNIIEDPKDEQSYLQLIYFYFEKGQKEKAYEIAKKLEQEVPHSKQVHIALYKFYLDEGNSDAAIASIMIVLKEDDIDKEFKFNMVKDLLIYVKKNPRLETKLTELVNRFGDDDENGKIYMILGDYFFEKGKKEEALDYYSAVSDDTPKEFDLLKSKILIQIDFKKFSKVASLSAAGIEKYPAQPVLYLFHGIANNELGKAKIALESLNNGVDYLIDDVKLEMKFYKQMARAYRILGVHEKADDYLKKAQELQSKL